VRDFLEAVARLRSTQERRRSDELDEATRHEREAFARVVELVRQRLTEAGSRDAPDTMARVTATLRGAAADPAHYDDLRLGTGSGIAGSWDVDDGWGAWRWRG
jgi:hypothetical protein